MNKESEKLSKRCLLLIPRHFYSFTRLFTTVLEDKGYEVIVSNDEYPSGNFGKILGKLRIPVLLPITDYVVSRDYLDGQRYDLILIFKGRGLSDKLVKKLMASSSRVVGYNWDSFKFNPGPLKWCRSVTRYCTFDYRDADVHGLPVVELFSSIRDVAGAPEKDYELSAIIRNHSGRLKYLDRVLKLLGCKNVFIYIYEQNLVFFLLNFLRSPILYFKYKKFIQFNSLPYDQYIDSLRRSEYTLDYAHPDQTGITMRCFEALSVGTKIITNNRYVERSPLFSDNYVVFADGDPDADAFVEAVWKKRSLAPQKTLRSIVDFIEELISER